jgi:hypothetical protein
MIGVLGICGLLLLILLKIFCQIKKKQWPTKMRRASRAAPDPNGQGGDTAYLMSLA